MTTEQILEILAKPDDNRHATSEIANALNISKKAAWVHLSNLKDEGLVQKHPGDDLHTDSWSITASGRKAADSLPIED